MSVELTIVGSINLDLVARVERLPRAEETSRGARGLETRRTTFSPRRA
jgi:sugar/nucleoside kinase (ribokinase family)